MPSNTVAIVHLFVLPGAQRCWLFTKKANANPTNGYGRGLQPTTARLSIIFVN